MAEIIYHTFRRILLFLAPCVAWPPPPQDGVSATPLIMSQAASFRTSPKKINRKGKNDGGKMPALEVRLSFQEVVVVLLFKAINSYVSAGIEPTYP